jgi:LysR family transcriptional regulator for metE and metH
MEQTRLGLEHLQLLDAVGRTGSLAQSAELLGLTQPALSYRLREAERRLGVALFEKARGRRIQMTAAGERLLPTASMVLREVKRAEADIRRLSDGIHYLLRLGAEARTSFLWLPQFLMRLKNEHPELEVDLETAPGRAGLEGLVRRQVDLAIVLGRDAGPAFKQQHLFDDELVAVMAASHDLATRRHIEPSDFADQPLIADDPANDGGVTARTVLTAAGVRPARFVDAGTPFGVIDLARAGYGLGIVSKRMVPAGDELDGLIALPIGSKGFRLPWQVAIRADEAEGSPASFMAERLSYWCEGPVSRTLPLVSP